MLAFRILMKLGFSFAALAALLFMHPSSYAEELRLDDVVAHAKRDVVAASPFEDNALLELRHRALMEAGRAQVSLADPLPRGTRIPAGPITVRQVVALEPRDERVVVLEMARAEIRQLLERAARAFAVYRFEGQGSLLEPGASESLLVSAEGLSYEIDLTAPAGGRIVNLAFGESQADTGRPLRVAATAQTAERLGLKARAAEGSPRIQDALLARLRQSGTLEPDGDHNWTVVPDYAPTPERPLIDRLVRLKAAPRDEVMRLFPDQLARRGEVAYWLGRAFGWRETKLSGAFPDVPDSLEPWVDALVKRRVLGSARTDEFFQPFTAARLPDILDWCKNAARYARYALDTEAERGSFRRSLLTGTSLAVSGGWPNADTVSRAQLLGMIANLRFPVVRVLETTDFHGAMEPGTYGPRPRGGSVALAQTIAGLRAENPEGTVLLDGGDAFQGTMISNLSFGRAVVEQMNRLGYAAMAIGNHEFDWTVDTLARRIDEMRFAALGANVVELRSGRRPRWARSDTLIRRRGVRIGILGLAYSKTGSATHPRNVAALRFGDDSTAAAGIPARLRAGGAEAIVAVGHVPATIDSAGVVHGPLARLAMIPGVDLWLGGHSHTWVSGNVRGIPTLIPGSHGEGVAVCDLVVDPVRHRVAERQVRLVPVSGDSSHRDAVIASIVERWGSVVEHESSQPVGVSSLPLTKHRGGESPIGSLVADVMRSTTGADVGLQNNGGLRAELPEGPVTRGAIYQVIPFENSIVTLSLKGSELRRVLEEALASERVVQVSGIRYRFDLGRPSGSRVTALMDEQSRPLDEQRVFRVACNDYMADGGDDLVTLKRGQSRVDTTIGLREALEEEVRERSARGPFRYEADGRVAREPGSPLPARD